MRVFAIDPGNIESAFVVYYGDTGEIVAKGKVSNAQLEHMIRRPMQADDGHNATHNAIFDCDTHCIEMVASYGMAVGASVFETCVAIGRFARCLEEMGKTAELVYRRDIKLHHCGQARAKDSNIKQALIDKYAKDTPNHGKGNNKNPGFFYGFSADVWAAFALAAFKVESEREELEFACAERGTA